LRSSTAQGHKIGFSNRLSGFALFPSFGFQTVGLLLVKNFTDVCVGSQPDVLSTHEFLKAWGEENDGAVLEENLVVVSILLATVVLGFGFVVARPLWEVG
jgi:hypothetical protein